MARAENYFIDVWLNQVRAAATALVRDLAGGTACAVEPANDELVEAVLALERPSHRGGRLPGVAIVVPLFAEYVRTRQSVV